MTSPTPTDSESLREKMMDSTDGTKKAHITPDGVEYVPMITVEYAVEIAEAEYSKRETALLNELHQFVVKYITEAPDDQDFLTAKALDKFIEQKRKET